MAAATARDQQTRIALVMQTLPPETRDNQPEGGREDPGRNARDPRVHPPPEARPGGRLAFDGSPAPPSARKEQGREILISRPCVPSATGADRAVLRGVVPPAPARLRGPAGRTRAASSCPASRGPGGASP